MGVNFSLSLSFSLFCWLDGQCFAAVLFLRNYNISQFHMFRLIQNFVSFNIEGVSVNISSTGLEIQEIPQLAVKGEIFIYCCVVFF